MSSFPPKRWRVRYLQDMDSIMGTTKEDEPISLEAYMAVQPSGGEEGAFRFVLTGREHLQVRIAVNAILPEKCFENMWISMQLEIGTQIRLERNSVASKWVDIVELVNAQDADVTDQEGEEVNERFIEAIESRKKEAPEERSGIVMRWLLGTFGEEQDIFLIAQALPCSLKVIEENPALRNDHTRGIMAAKFKVAYEEFDGTRASGMYE